MATENTIRKRAKDKLTEDGWIVSMPKRQRYGSTTTTLPEGETFENDKQYKGHDDIFSLFDCIAWRKDKMRFIQYTSVKDHNGQIKAHRDKINSFMKERNVQIPKGTTIEIWGYGVGGFDVIETLETIN